MEHQLKRLERRSGKFPEALVWIAGIALTLFCVVGIAAIMGWIPNALGRGGDKSAAGPTLAVPVPTVTAPVARVHRTVPPLHAPAAKAVPAQVAAVANCAECGVIESVHELDAKGKASGIGAAGGAVMGGLLGNQVGAGRGQDAMTVAGAAGGAVAGNEVEQRVKTSKSYEVVVRLHDGSSRVISEGGAPEWHIGDKVRIVNGAIHSNA